MTSIIILRALRHIICMLIKIMLFQYGSIISDPEVSNAEEFLEILDDEITRK